MGCWFARSLWNVVDLVNLSLFVVVICLRIWVVCRLASLDYGPLPTEYRDFYSVAFALLQVQNVLAVACILSYLKLLRYLQLSPRLSQLTQTISTAAFDLIGFLLIFVVVFCAFAQAPQLRS